MALSRNYFLNLYRGCEYPETGIRSTSRPGTSSSSKCVDPKDINPEDWKAWQERERAQLGMDSFIPSSTPSPPPSSSINALPDTRSQLPFWKSGNPASSIGEKKYLSYPAAGTTTLKYPPRLKEEFLVFYNNNYPEPYNSQKKCTKAFSEIKNTPINLATARGWINSNKKQTFASSQ